MVYNLDYLEYDENHKKEYINLEYDKSHKKEYINLEWEEINYFLDEEILEELDEIENDEILEILEEYWFLDENFLENNIYWNYEQNNSFIYYEEILKILFFLEDLKILNNIYYTLYDLSENIKKNLESYWEIEINNYIDSVKIQIEKNLKIGEEFKIEEELIIEEENIEEYETEDWIIISKDKDKNYKDKIKFYSTYSFFEKSKIYEKFFNWNILKEDIDMDYLINNNSLQNIILILGKLEENNNIKENNIEEKDNIYIELNKNIFYNTFFANKENIDIWEFENISRDVAFNWTHLILDEKYNEIDNEFIQNFIWSKQFEYYREWKLFFNINLEDLKEIKNYIKVLKNINKVKNISKNTFFEQELFFKDLLINDRWFLKELPFLNSDEIKEIIDLWLKNNKNKFSSIKQKVWENIKNTFINYEIITKESLKNEYKDNEYLYFEKERLIEDFYSLYENIYTDKNILKITKEYLTKLINEENFLRLHKFDIWEEAVLTLYEKEIDENTVYIWGLNSNKYFIIWFKFAKEIVEKVGKYKDIEISVYKTVWDQKNRYRGLTKEYKKLWFKEESEDEDKIWKYIKMRRPKDLTKKGVN